MINRILQNLLPLVHSPPQKLYIIAGEENLHYILFALRLLFDGVEIPIQICNSANDLPGAEKTLDYAVIHDGIDCKQADEVKERCVFAFAAPANSNSDLKKILLAKRLRIRRIAVVITTRCTLRCPHCLHLNSRYAKREDFPAEQVLSCMRRILAITETVEAVSLMGGEAMLHPQLALIMAELCREERLGEVSVTTNGTLPPSAELLSIWKHPKANVFISNYDAAVSPNTPELLNLLKKNNIRYRISDPDKPWIDAGGTESRGRSPTELEKMYARCLYASCATLLNGALYNCPRNANAVNQGLIPWELSGGVDLEADTVENALKEQILETLYIKQSIACCDRCDFIPPKGPQALIQRAT